MFRIAPPIRLIPTAEAKVALGADLRAAAFVAYREIALAAKGLEIAHLQFAHGAVTLAVCSRVRWDGTVEIEMGLGDARRPSSCFTAAQMQRAEAAARQRLQAARRSRTNWR